MRAAGFFAVVSLIMFGLAAATFWPVYSSKRDHPSHPVPGSFAQHLDEGDHALLVLSATRTRVGGPEAPVRFTMTGASVYGPDGLAVDVREPDEPESHGDSERVYVGRARFDVAESGIHSISIAGAGSTEAFAARSHSAVVVRFLGLFLLGMASAFLAMIAAFVGGMMGYGRPRADRYPENFPYTPDGNGW